MKIHQLSLELLGPVKVSILGQLVKSGLWAKSLALLAYIVSENNVVHRRDILAEAFYGLTNQRCSIDQPAPGYQPAPQVNPLFRRLSPYYYADDPIQVRMLGRT